MAKWTTTELELAGDKHNHPLPRILLRKVRANWWVGTFQGQQVCVGTLPQVKQDAEARAQAWVAQVGTLKDNEVTKEEAL